MPKHLEVLTNPHGALASQRSWLPLLIMVRGQIDAWGGTRAAAKFLGMDAASLSRIARGMDYPSVLTLGKLIEWLGIGVWGIREVETSSNSDYDGANHEART